MKISEQLKALQNERAAKVARMKEIQEKAASENRNKDAAEGEEFETLETEIKAIDRELKDLRSLEKLSVAQARTVGEEQEDPTDVDPDEPGGANRQRGRSDTGNGGAAPGAGPHVQTMHLRQKLAPGILFARYVKCIGAAKGDATQAENFAKLHYPDTPQIREVIKAGLIGGNVGSILQKAAVAGATPTDATWAGPLMQYTQFAGDFINYLRPLTILGKFGTGNVPGLRAVPFNIHIRGQTSGGSGYWVGAGKAKPLTKADFSDVYLGFAKVANIAVLTEELLRFSNPSAEVLVRDMLGEALIARLDTDFVDPAKAAVANTSPASITNGVVADHSSGVTAAHVREDIATAMTHFITANIAPTSLVWIMPATIAMKLSLLRNAFGQKEFPDINVNGGSLEGVPVIPSQYVPSYTAGALVILASAQDIWLADDGAVTVDASREASLEMSDAPTNTPDTPTATSLVSMFQTNSVALRAERYINWQKRRTAAVAVLDQVVWSGG